MRSLIYFIRPDLSHPDGDEWEDAVPGIKCAFKSIKDRIYIFLCSRSGVLPVGVRETLEKCYYACDRGAMVTSSYQQGDEGDSEADELWSGIMKAEKDFRGHLQL
jgi:hypothetical protein